MKVFIESFDGNNGMVTYCLNSAIQNPVFHTNETVFILNGKEVSIEAIAPIANRPGTPAKIEINNNMLTRLEITK